MLPESVLSQIQKDLMTLPGVGMSILEVSHRSSVFEEILGRVEANIRELARVPANYHVFFLQGGASQQFSMVPMNLLGKAETADYCLTGVWAKKAAMEAQKFGNVNIAATTEQEDFSRLPSVSEFRLTKGASYVHLTSNNTVVGTQWRDIPELGDCTFVVDASSDIFSRPIDFSRFGLVYAGAQKNLGPAGVTVVIVRNDLVRPLTGLLPTLMCYETFVRSGSLYNTPPVFAIYVMALVTDWIREAGGLLEMERRNERKARALYEAVDRRSFYQGTAKVDSRSWMNITFRLPNSDLDALFAREALSAGLSGLEGHRSVGGLRASIYNAFPETGVEALIDFMGEFERTHG